VANKCLTTLSLIVFTQRNLAADLQYGARDKSLSGVVDRPTPSESLRLQLASQAESNANSQFNSSEPLRALVSGDVINKSLSGVEDKP